MFLFSSLFTHFFLIFPLISSHSVLPFGIQKFADAKLGRRRRPP
jgi:hypothetical protein